MIEISAIATLVISIIFFDSSLGLAYAYVSVSMYANIHKEKQLHMCGCASSHLQCFLVPGSMYLRNTVYDINPALPSGH